jgi:hypothetical protein
VPIERPEVLNVLTIDVAGHLFVDGQALADLVTAAERALGARDPGGYAWLHRSLVVLPSRHLFGDPSPGSDWDQDWASHGYDRDSVAIGGCGCGVVGCHPLVVVIEQGDGLVRWRSFASRAGNPLPLGPFVFGARRYEAALRGS